MESKEVNNNDTNALSSLMSSYELTIRHHCSKEIASKFESLIESAKLFDQTASNYSFGSININGFTMFNHISSAFASEIVDQIKSKGQIDSNFLKVFDLIFTYRDWLLDTLNVLENDSKHPSLASPGSSLNVREISSSSKYFFNAARANGDTLPLLLASKYTGFWLQKEFSTFLKYYHLWLAIINKFPSSLFNVLFSQHGAGKECSKHFRNASIKSPFNTWHQSENWFSLKFLDLYLNHQLPKIKSVTLQIKRQKRFRLTYNGVVIDFDRASNELKDAYLSDSEQQARLNAPGMRHRNSNETVKCRYSFSTDVREGVERKFVFENDDYFKGLNYQNSRRSSTTAADYNTRSSSKNQESKPLLLYMHGGGFLATGSRTSEVFLRDIVDKLNGIPVLSIDYSLTVPFPVPIQEILDVYLWLFSGQESVVELIGFHPTEVVLLGDSAGGLFATSLAILINELNKQLNDKERLPRPKSLVLAYPAITISNISPSKTLLAFEPLIEVHLYLLLFSVVGANLSTVGDFKQIEKTDRYQHIAMENKKLFAKEPSFQTSPLVESTNVFNNIKDSSAWFQCNDYLTYKTRADYIASFYNNPLITPALYAPHFDQLSDIQLFVLTGANDLMLDDSIDLSDKWKGSVCLDVFPGMMHGFLHFKHATAETKRVGNLVIKRLQEAFGV